MVVGGGAHSFRERLRAATARAHERLDDRISSFDLGEPDAYRAFLIMHSAVLPPLEAGIARACADAPELDLAARSRTSALTADLETMGARPAAPLPVAEPASLAEALGALYVLEGSRLGAQILIRRVRASGDARVRAATAFLEHGSPDLWRSFLDAASSYVVDEDALCAASDGALSAFGAFHLACSQYFPLPVKDERARV